MVTSVCDCIGVCKAGCSVLSTKGMKGSADMWNIDKQDGEPICIHYCDRSRTWNDPGIPGSVVVLKRSGAG